MVPDANENVQFSLALETLNDGMATCAPLY